MQIRKTIAANSIGLALLVIAQSAHSQIYLCINPDGTKVYADEPCAEDSVNEKILQPSDKPTGFQSFNKICALELDESYETITPAAFNSEQEFPPGERTEIELKALQGVLLLHDAADNRIVAKKDEDIHVCVAAQGDQPGTELVIADNGDVYELAADPTLIIGAPKDTE